jgi:hypothetical protein
LTDFCCCKAVKSRVPSPIFGPTHTSCTSNLGYNNPL